MKYTVIVDDKGEIIAAEAAISNARLTDSPVIKSGQKVVEIDIPTEAAKKPAKEIMQHLKSELQRMK